MPGLTCGDGRQWAQVRPLGLPCGSLLAGSALVLRPGQSDLAVRVPDSTTTSTPHRSPSLVASTKLSNLSDDFDAALRWARARQLAGAQGVPEVAVALRPLRPYEEGGDRSPWPGIRSVFPVPDLPDPWRHARPGLDLGS